MYVGRFLASHIPDTGAVPAAQRSSCCDAARQEGTRVKWGLQICTYGEDREFVLPSQSLLCWYLELLVWDRMTIRGREGSGHAPGGPQEEELLPHNLELCDAAGLLGWEKKIQALQASIRPGLGEARLGRVAALHGTPSEEWSNNGGFLGGASDCLARGGSLH